MRSLTTLLVSLLTAAVAAVDVHGSIKFVEGMCPDIKALKPTRVTLDSGAYSAHVWRDGRFILRDVEPGSYVLNVLARDHIFDQLRVDVIPKEKPEAKGDTPKTATGITSAAPSVTPGPLAPIASSISDPNYHINIYPLPFGSPHYAIPSPPQLPYPIVLKPKSSKVYVEPKKDFNIIDLFKGNPVMLIMLGSVVMMFVMPKIIANMDPQEREEFLAQQNKMMAMPAQLSQGLSALTDNRSAGSSSQPQAKLAPAATNPSESSASPRKRKGGKR